MPDSNRQGEGSTHTVSSRQDELPEQIPGNLAFLWSVDAVQLIHDSAPRFRSACKTKENDICHYWLPQNEKMYFKKEKGHLYRWKMGNSTRITDSPLNNLRRHSVVSVFFQERQDNFLVAGKDCTVEDVKEGEEGWCQIRFNHVAGDLSEVGFGGYPGLGAPALGSSWMPQVLPEVYNYHMKDPSVPKKPVGTGGLCGNLSILIGMAAFSASVDKAEEAIIRSFKLGRWDRHSFAQDGDCRYQDRGVIATIYVDPKANGITEEVLRDFEGGKYGPIFTAELAPRLLATEQMCQQRTQEALLQSGGVPRFSPAGNYPSYSETDTSSSHYTYSPHTPSSRFPSSRPIHLTAGSSPLLYGASTPQATAIGFGAPGEGGDEPRNGDS